MLARTPLRWQRITYVLAILVAALVGSARSAAAQPGSHFFKVEIDSSCSCTYDVTAWGWTDANAQVTITYTFTVTSGGVTYTVNRTISGNADQYGAFNINVPGLSLPGDCTAASGVLFSGVSATSSDSIAAFYDFDFEPGGLSCSSTPPPNGKTFSIGPSSMEGNLNIRPGDWVSGGYSFVFTQNTHIATTVTVTGTLTVPFRCADGTTGQFVVNLGTDAYNVPAGNTSWQPTGDANSILSWMGSAQAPAGCGAGGVMNNSKGAIFNATVSQSPDTGSLLNWRFKYRDPNAKGKGNVNCLDATDPRRNDAATCGASWSQTVKDP